MIVKKIDGYTGLAQSLSKEAEIVFNLYVDEEGEFYVQLLGSLGGGNVNTSLLFSISEHNDHRKSKKDVESISGYKLKEKNSEKTINKIEAETTDVINNVNFLAAVIKHLVPKKRKVRASDIKIDK